MIARESESIHPSTPERLPKMIVLRDLARKLRSLQQGDR